MKPDDRSSGDGLDGLQRSLCGLATGLLGRPLAVAAADASSLGPRSIITTQHLLLSRSLPEAGEARGSACAAAVAHAVAHLLFSPLAQPARLLKPMGQAVVSALEDARVEQLLARRFPGVRRWFAIHRAPLPEPGIFSFEALITRLDWVLAEPDHEDDNHWVNKARRLFLEARDRHGLEDAAAFRASASILANDLGQMRVRFDPQHYVVPSAYRDDNSVLWTFDRQEEDQEQTLSVSQAARALPRSDPVPPGADGPSSVQEEVELGRYVHPEWHHRLALWRRDWCTVVEKLPATSLAGTVSSQRAWWSREAPLSIQRLRRLSRRHRLRRQWEGDDIDLNAAIDVMVDRRARLQPEPRLFLRPGRESTTSSILILLDLSESTNDLSTVTGRSLLDLEKQAAWMLAQATGHSADRIAIHGFLSNTRAEVSYYRLLDWDQPVDELACSRVMSVSARHSTRLGAALRQATSHLQVESGRYRGILVVTDGEPADVDVFEPDYLVEDARMAVQQAQRLGIRTFCLAVDPKADRYVRRIFGWRDYGIADDPHQLPVQLQRAYVRLAAG
ncbi:nitric oxide reductase activation protein NorD [Hydrogenophaga sp. R2]|uniref:nitric oxide reductase activation protein NorD n=1 Tax=Hydrogenophaga sp. R2 TaxID=3132827 RepID=UPI003CEFB96A